MSAVAVTAPRATGGPRARHPSARAAGGHLAGPAAQVVGRLPGVDGPHREVAVAALAVRGGQGRSRAGFAAAYGLPVDVVAALESGQVALGLVPTPLLVLTPLAQVAATLLASGPAAVPGTPGPRDTVAPPSS